MQRTILPALIGVLLVLAVSGAALYAQTAEDGNPPQRIYGEYSSTYYGRFADWEIFPAMIPMVSMDGDLRYEERFDLTQPAQIVGRHVGDVADGTYYIELPESPDGASWLDTDGDPATPSDVKVFVVGIANGIINTDYVSRYDFLYTRSFRFDPNTRLWDGSLLVWSARNNATFPILNGEDNAYYTADDVLVKVPQGWSVVEVQAKVGAGRESVRVYATTQPFIQLAEPTYLADVDLSNLSYGDAFNTLIDELARTYIFTEYRNIDWEAIRATYAPRAAQITDPQAYQQLLQDALFSFRDGHLVIYGAGLPADMTGRLGLRVFPYDDGLIVVDVYDQSPIGTQSPIIPGTVITEVNGLDARAYFDTIPPVFYSGGHAEISAWMRGDFAFRAAPGTPFNLHYRLPDGTEIDQQLDTVRIDEISRTATQTPAQRDVVYYDILPSGIGVIGIRNFTSAQVDDLWNAAMDLMIAQQVPGIVIDLRQNGGGFSLIPNYMFGDFLDEDVYSGREVSSLDEDGDGEIDITDEFYYGRERRFDPANVVVMIGPDCFSACEFAAQGFKDLGATVIGHLTSGGAGGGVGASYFLPGNTLVYGMAVVRSEDPDGNILVEGTGVPLDVQVPFSPQDLASGYDTLLAVAQDLLLR